MHITNKYALSAFAGVSLVGALTGCSSSTTPATTSSDASASTAPSSASAGTGTASTRSYKDGSYSADGTYQSPAGVGRITVNLTLASGVVTAITTNGHASDPTARSYQADFDAGIAGNVVGKKIDSLNVTNVSGSSLTSGGFDAAVKAIEAKASA